MNQVKKIFIFILFFVFSLLFVSPLIAQTKPGIAPDRGSLLPMPPLYNNKGSFLGENQFYTLTLRGNGEAVVVAKILLTNLDNPINTTRLEFPPNINPQDIAIYQILQEPQCIQYQPTPLPAPPGVKPEIIKEPPCLQYQQPNYEYIYATNATYQKVPFNQQGNTITLTFPKTIEQNGAYVLYYRTFGYTKKNIFGAYDFAFESLKVDDKISALTLGIKTDSDYILKGVKGNVNYGSVEKTMAVPAIQSSDRNIINPSFSEFYNQIGQGTIVKRVTDLSPLHTYETSGLYADSNIKLYGTEIAVTGIVILLTLLGIIWIIRVVIKKLSQEKTEEHTPASNAKLFLLSTGLSFVSVILLAMYTFCVVILSNYVASFGYYQFNTFIMLFVFMISALVYLFLLFTPAIIMGLQKGIRWGIATFGLTVCWIIVALFLALAALFFWSATNNNGGYPSIIYPMTKGIEPVMMRPESVVK